MNLQDFAQGRFCLFVASSVGLSVAIVWSVRLAAADYEAAQTDLASVTRACDLAPGSAGYRLRASAVRQIDAPDEREAAAATARALELNPRYTEAWMERAMQAEIAGRTADAEQDYLRAEQTNHMYKPAWALANFYLRQENVEKFWVYARKCLEVVEPRRLEPRSYDPSPVFDIAWRVTQDAGEIRRRLIPPRHFILVDYLEYLRVHNRMEPGSAVAMDLAKYADRADNWVLLNFCEQLINLPKGRGSVELWNAMVDRGMLRAEHLDAGQGRSMTNADLKRPFERVGFDWRMPAAEGVLENHFPETGEARLEFSGDQPEGVLVLYQSLPVAAGAYRLSFRYRTPGMDHADGLTWVIWDYAGQRTMAIECKLRAEPEWTRGEARFPIPNGVSLVRLGLEYRRTSGSTRIRGTAAFGSFALSRAETARW